MQLCLSRFRLGSGTRLCHIYRIPVYRTVGVYESIQELERVGNQPFAESALTSGVFPIAPTKPFTMLGCGCAAVAKARPSVRGKAIVVG